MKFRCFLRTLAQKAHSMATLTLRNIPKPELEHLLKEQLKNRLAKGRSYSLEMTALKIFREHKDFKEKKND